MIPQTDCIKGGVYDIRSRNLDVGVYDGAGGFIGIRQKFSSRYLFTERHYDEGPPFGTVTPIRLLCMLPEGIEPVEHLTHELGPDWLPDGTGGYIPTVRRQLREGEQAHGKRQGFVDEYVGGARLPDDTWPVLRSNTALFDYLDKRLNAPATCPTSK